MVQTPNPKATELRSPELAPSSIIHSPAASWGPREVGLLAAAKPQKLESEGVCPTVASPTSDQARGVWESAFVNLVAFLEPVGHSLSCFGSVS